MKLTKYIKDYKILRIYAFYDEINTKWYWSNSFLRKKLTDKILKVKSPWDLMNDDLLKQGMPKIKIEPMPADVKSL